MLSSSWFEFRSCRCCRSIPLSGGADVRKLCIDGKEFIWFKPIDLISFGFLCWSNFPVELLIKERFFSSGVSKASSSLPLKQIPEFSVVPVSRLLSRTSRFPLCFRRSKSWLIVQILFVTSFFYFLISTTNTLILLSVRALLLLHCRFFFPDCLYGHFPSIFLWSDSLRKVFKVSHESILPYYRYPGSS